MAKGGVVFQDVEELKRDAEEISKEWIEADERGELDAIWESFREDIACAEKQVRFKNVRLLSIVRDFCEEIKLSICGDCIGVKLNLSDGLIGEMATVRIIARRLCINSMEVIRKFKSIIYSVDILDHTDGTFEVVFGFNGALICMKEE